MAYAFAGHRVEAIIDKNTGELAPEGVTAQLFLPGTTTPVTTYTNRTKTGTTGLATNSDGNLHIYAEPGPRDLRIGATTTRITIPVDPEDIVSRDQVGVANGVAALDASALIPAAQVPSIARTKLASDVQTSLGKADTALQPGGTSEIAPDATTTSKGIVQLTNHLSGTASAPTVPGLASKAELSDPRFTDQRVPTDASVTPAKLHSTVFGTTAGTVTQGNDSRIAGAEQTANKNQPNGYPGLSATPGTMDGTTVLYGDGVYRTVAVTGGAGKDYISVKDAPYSALGNDTADDRAAIQAAIDACPEGGVVLLPPGKYRIGGPLVMRSLMTLKGSHWTRWPYVVSGTWSPPCSIKTTGTFSGGDAMILFNDGIQHSNIENLYLDGNSYPTTGPQVGGIWMSGLVRSIEIEKVGIFQTSSHGFMTREGTGAAAGRYPRGITYKTCSVWSAGNASGDNATNQQDGWNLAAFTDSSLIDCEAKDNRRGGFKVGGAGDTELISCRAPFNRGGPGFYIHGGDASFSSGNGGLRITSCSSDRNYGEGLLIDAVGRQRILVANSDFRRDGGNNETGTPTAAGVAISGATSTSPVAPVFLDNVATAVEDADDNNGWWTPVTGFYFQHITQVSMNNCHVWGRNASIVQGTGSTGGKIKTSGTNWYYTGLPTAKTIVNPSIT